MASKKTIVTFLILGLVAVATGCSDNNNAIVAAPDTAPPALPTNLEVALEDGMAVISWDSNEIDSDLAGYIVTREYRGETETLVATPTLTTTFEDSTPPVGSSSYHVYAVDTTGNESAVATAYLMVAVTHNDYVRAE
jgi:hypothetical protein